MPGDVCTIELDLQANHGFVPEPLFDASGRISFVLDHGNYLPAIHELVRGRAVDVPAETSVLRNIEIDAGYGAYRKDLVLKGVPLQKLRGLHNDNVSNDAPSLLQEGDTIYLGQPPVPALVTQIDAETATLDLNPPLAGSSYNCRFLRVINIEPSPWTTNVTTTTAATSPFQIATLSLGCFWGAELFGMRIPGVVGTRVGYVVNGKTEAIQLLFDTRVVSYEQLIRRAVGRSKELRESVVWGGDWLWEQQQEQHDDAKYRHGVYCHDAEQFQTARQVLGKNPSRDNNMRLHQHVPVESFQVADPDQQQYLYKGGQSARKNAKAPIRCFG